MGKRKQGVTDMFAVLEHTQLTAHFPASSDPSACMAFYPQVIQRFDEAMMGADVTAALAAKKECDLFLDHVYRPFKDSRGISHNDVSRQLSKSYRAPEGEIPKWGQEGTFTITIGSVPVRVEMDALCSLGMYGENLLPHFSIHIVEKHRLFLSHTGYRSFFTSLIDTEPGFSIADAVGRILREYVQKDLKGKLEKYDPYKGYSPKHRQELIDAERVLAPEADSALEPTEESNPVEDDDLLCDGCNASLTMVDEFVENECGTLCGRCFLDHSRTCDACELDLIDAHGGTHPAPNRSESAYFAAQQAVSADALSQTSASVESFAQHEGEEEACGANIPQLSLF